MRLFGECSGEPFLLCYEENSFVKKLDIRRRRGGRIGLCILPEGTENRV